jgi:hypothetical protein
MKMSKPISLSVIICQLSVSIVLTSCTTDAYDKGEGELSLMRSDMVEAHVNEKKYVDYVLTDDGDSLPSLKPFTVTWINTPDTMYRAILSYNSIDGRAEALGLSQVITLPLRSSDYYHDSPPPQHPLYVESAWVAFTRRYLNLRIRLLTSQPENDTQRHTLGIVSDSITTTPDGLRVNHMRLLHNQNGLPEYYSTVANASILLKECQADSIVLSAVTYEGLWSKGWRIR